MQQHTQDEVWLPVVGYEGRYEVSSHGNVRSLDRLVPYSDGRISLKRGRQLKPMRSNGASEGGRHLKVELGRKNLRYVHHLVLEAFVGPRPTGYAGCHNDGDPANNRADNLRWDTYRGNQLDQLAHGTHPFAKRTSCKRGHPYTPENTQWKTIFKPGRVEPTHARICLTCSRERAREGHRRRQAAKNSAA